MYRQDFSTNLQPLGLCGCLTWTVWRTYVWKVINKKKKWINNSQSWPCSHILDARMFDCNDVVKLPSCPHFACFRSTNHASDQISKNPLTVLGKIHLRRTRQEFVFYLWFCKATRHKPQSTRAVQKTRLLLEMDFSSFAWPAVWHRLTVSR